MRRTWLLACGLSVGSVRVGVALPLSAPVQGVSRPPHTASRDCRNGSPLARAIPCAPVPECGVTREKEKSGLTMQRRAKAPCISARAPTRSAASRDGMAGWAGEGGGRFGERREYEAPTLPSPPRQHGMARHHTSQPRNSTPPQNKSQARNSTPRQHGKPRPPDTSAEIRQRGMAHHHQSQSRNGTPPHTSAKNPQRQPQNTCLVKMRIADIPHPFQVWARGHSRCGFKLKNCSAKSSKKCELLVHI